MSIVGTRPPLISETNLYEPRHKARLQVLRKLAEQEDIAGDFHNKRILVIHSGGDSKRVPQYSVCFLCFDGSGSL